MMRRIGWVGLLAIGLALSCGGGGGDGGGGVVTDSGGSTTYQVGLTPDATNPGADSVWLAQLSTSADLVTVAVRVNGVDDLYGGAFDLLYDPSRAALAGWDPGGLLESGGSSVQYQVQVPQPGRVVVGFGRVAGGGLDVSGTGILVRLTFRLTANGSSDVDFEDAFLLDDSNPPATIPGIAWHGGEFVRG